MGSLLYLGYAILGCPARKCCLLRGLRFSTSQFLQLVLSFVTLAPQPRNLDIGFPAQLHQFCCQGVLSFSATENFPSMG
ncbi:hypothetical protein AMK31_14305 [Streptomyces sp. TSRI0107]|nr:hypothetical protein AMK31_14305 [Streptomyces sp. TSRI0107]